MEELIDNKMSRNVEKPKVFSFCKVLPSHLTAWVRKTRKHFKTWFLIKLTNLPCNTLINCHRKQIFYCPISKQGWCRVKKKLLHCVTVWPATVSHNVSHNATFLDIFKYCKSCQNHLERFSLSFCHSVWHSFCIWPSFESQTCAVQQGSLLDISVMRRLGKLILK